MKLKGMQGIRNLRLNFRQQGNKIGFLLTVILLIAVMITGCTNVGINNSAPTATEIAEGLNILNLADDGPITLDPATAAESQSVSYIVQIFSGLVRLDENLQIIPDIARTWDKSADGMTFTFHLHQDVKFHDGKPVTASDFKYSWERALNPETGSLTAQTYLNDIVGATDILSGGETQLSGVQVLDDYTLQVTIDAPKQYFLQKMAYPTAFVVDQSNISSGDTWWRQPNGTGPFKLEQWQQDEVIILARNDDYYGEKARLDKVVFYLYSGNSIELYQTGDIDVSYVASAYMGLVTDPANTISQELVVFPQLSFYYIGFNTTVPPFDDTNVRLAFSYAVDKEKITTLSLDNVVATAYGILPPDMPGYDSSLQGIPFDVPKAKELIAASRYGDVSQLPPITFTISGWGGVIPDYIGGILEEWRHNLGVEIKVRQLEPEVYYYMLNQEKDNLFSNGWIADYPDPQNFLDILFRTGAANNTGGYSNPELDSLLERAAVEDDAENRLQMYREAEQIVVHDAVLLPLFFGENYVLVKPYVKNYTLSPLGYPLLTNINIQK